MVLRNAALEQHRLRPGHCDAGEQFKPRASLMAEDDNKQAEQDASVQGTDWVRPTGGRPHLVPILPPSLSNKVRRLAWIIVWTIAARWTPIPLHGWRCAVARLFGARLGKGVALYPSTRIWAPWNLTMGDRSCLAEGVRCYNVETVSIASDVVVSQYASICTASHNPHHADFTLIGAPITIAKNAWIASEVFLSPGVTIGARAVAAARAVVVHDVASDFIVGGNPAKPLKKREIKT